MTIFTDFTIQRLHDERASRLHDEAAIARLIRAGKGRGAGRRSLARRFGRSQRRQYRGMFETAL